MKAQRRQWELQPAAAEVEREVWAGSVGGAAPEMELAVSLQGVLWEVVLKVEDLRLKTKNR